MRVCMIGDASEPLDEGMKKTTHSLASAIAKHCDVLVLNPLQALGTHFWSSMRRHHPDVIHYVPGPSLRSFLLLALARVHTLAATVMSLTHPDPSLPRRFACRFLGPDLLLSQSVRSEELFRGLGCRIQHVPNGVDTGRFRPVSPAEKKHLRHKHGIIPESFVVLHVGNMRQARHLDVLTRLQRDRYQVIVVGSTTVPGDSNVAARLTGAGCLVWNRYIEAIEEIYALADCYAFPTPTGVGAIEHPLSVMEAMACNLPVVTKRFGALPRIFDPGDGLYFVDTDDELISVIECIRRTGVSPTTRAKVADMEWDRIAVRIVALYRDLVLRRRRK
jgi:glycosyltransferase involved in cell wall biosynthesis